MAPAVFIKDRGGRAPARLPDGSQTTLACNSLTQTSTRGCLAAVQDRLGRDGILP